MSALSITFPPPILVSPLSLGFPATERLGPAGPLRALRAGGRALPSCGWPPGGDALRCRASRRGRGSLSSRSWPLESPRHCPDGPSGHTRPARGRFSPVLCGVAQPTVRCIDLLDERVVDHRRLLSLIPIRTSRAAIYAPLRQHHCPT